MSELWRFDYLPVLPEANAAPAPQLQFLWTELHASVHLPRQFVFHLRCTDTGRHFQDGQDPDQKRRPSAASPCDNSSTETPKVWASIRMFACYPCREISEEHRHETELCGHGVNVARHVILKPKSSCFFRAHRAIILFSDLNLPKI